MTYYFRFHFDERVERFEYLKVYNHCEDGADKAELGVSKHNHDL